LDDFTAATTELRFLWPDGPGLTRWGGPGEGDYLAPPTQRQSSLLEGVTGTGENAGLWLCEEGDELSLLWWRWLRPVVLRRTDRSRVLTIRRRHHGFASSAEVRGADGQLHATVRREGPRRRGSYLARDAHGAEVLRCVSSDAAGALVSMLGVVLVREIPVDRELLRLTFAPGAAPLVRAALFGVALLCEHDLRGG
jgi:hypothetical protein